MTKLTNVLSCLSKPIHISQITKKTGLSLKEIKDILKTNDKPFVIDHGKIFLK